MLIHDLYKAHTKEGEQYFLEHKIFTSSEDGEGDLIPDWEPVIELTGYIENQAKDPNSNRGSEEIGDYYGSFEPNFEIGDGKEADYRIKHIYPTDSLPFIRYFRIKGITRNLILHGVVHNYEMTLELMLKDE